MVGSDGIVVSCIIISPDVDISPFVPAGCTPVVAEGGNVGWTYRDGIFTPPAVVAQEPPASPQPTLQEALVQLAELKAQLDRLAAAK